MPSFEDVLGECEPHPLAAAMQSVRHSLPMADNLGRSGDRRNVYALVDELVGGILQAFPVSLCGPGCGQCCDLHRALIRIYRSEWEVVHDHLLATRTSDQLRSLVIDFWERFESYIPLLDYLQAELDAGRRPRVTAEELPLRCPFVQDGSCSVYPVRPAICRGYGHFALEQEGREGEIFACRMQQETLRPQLEAEGLHVKLPEFRPLYQRVADLCEDDEKLLIPLWFARTFPKA